MVRAALTGRGERLRTSSEGRYTLGTMGGGGGGGQNL